ncbi:MAB_1171c family putative transporter [Saccharopolyspora sp. 6V]|uniref:MAB_1171c family putative transporter n=1 Tax=Saccharopolyspora sp. 6V TaxID=2877239 RepID=UPI0027DFEE35|nr:MAB_1171c family putative transporter [Saccharopolyspora sp. 6V]
MPHPTPTHPNLLLAVLSAAVAANLLSASSTAAGVLLGPENEVVPQLRRVYLGFIVVAIPGLAVGLALPILVSMAAAAPLWWRHWQEYRALGPLWKRVHQTFPGVTLRRPIGAVRPWSIHARRYRRACEIRDGLLMLAPYYPVRPDAAASAVDVHAANVEEAFRAREETRHEGSEAVGGPVNAPIPQGEHTASLDDDVRWLTQLSKAIFRPGTKSAVQP